MAEPRKFQNVSPTGALRVPLLRRVVDAGEIIEVTDDQAELLAVQPHVWHEVTGDNPTEFVPPEPFATNPVPEPTPGVDEQAEVEPPTEEPVNVQAAVGAAADPADPETKTAKVKKDASK